MRPVILLLCATYLFAIFQLAYSIPYLGEHGGMANSRRRGRVLFDDEPEYDPGVVFTGNNPLPSITREDTMIGRLTKRDLPREWDWRDHAHLSEHITQRNPSWCGSCFSHASVSAITDRFRIAYPKESRYISLSSQQVLNCANDAGFGPVGCLGSEWEKVYGYIQSKGLVDQTCMPYTGNERSVSSLKYDCEKYQCRECTSDGQCYVVQPNRIWKIKSWGKVSGEEDMMAELFSRGPLTCYIYTYIPPYINYESGIISDPTKFAPYNITHVVSLVGYGEEKGVPYWVARNWAGTRWGEDGFFRVYRGNNTMNLEWNCGYAIPTLSQD